PGRKSPLDLRRPGGHLSAKVSVDPANRSSRSTRNAAALFSQPVYAQWRVLRSLASGRNSHHRGPGRVAAGGDGKRGETAEIQLQRIALALSIEQRCRRQPVLRQQPEPAATPCSRRPVGERRDG